MTSGFREKGCTMLTVRDLVKIYPGPVAALQGVDLDIPNGMFGLLGSNGAGKTTLMRILAGLLEPTSGKAALDGESILEHPETIWSRLGYLFGEGLPTPPFARPEVSRGAPTVVNWETFGRRGRAGQETLPEAARISRGFGLSIRVRTSSGSIAVFPIRRLRRTCSLRERARGEQDSGQTCSSRGSGRAWSSALVRV